jgi:hypothetical protein
MEPAASRKRPRPEGDADAPPGATVDDRLLQRLGWLDSRLANLPAAVPLASSVDLLAPPSRGVSDAAGLSAALHARRMRRRINAGLLAEADPVPVSQIKVVRGCVTVVKPPAAFGRGGAPVGRLPGQPPAAGAVPGAGDGDGGTSTLLGIVAAVLRAGEWRPRGRAPGTGCALATCGHSGRRASTAAHTHPSYAPLPPAHHRPLQAR